jgi:hypothetical protein
VRPQQCKLHTTERSISYALFSQLVMHAHIYDMVLENYGPPEEALPGSRSFGAIM